MRSIRGRVEKLERFNPCSECGGGWVVRLVVGGRYVSGREILGGAEMAVPEEEPDPECCPRCGRPLRVQRIVIEEVIVETSEEAWAFAAEAKEGG